MTWQSAVNSSYNAGIVVALTLGIGAGVKAVTKTRNPKLDLNVYDISMMTAYLAAATIIKDYLVSINAIDDDITTMLG